jgi:hypothetical protein
MRISLRGDAQLLYRIPGISNEDYLFDDLKAAYCWNEYGLPDGSVSPKGVLMAPSQQDLELAFNQLLGRLLPRNEQWLLEVPRRFINAHALSGRLLCSSEGGVAVLLPRGILGGLFYANELFWELKLGEETALPQECREFAMTAMPRLLAYWLLAEDGPPYATKLELEMSRLRRTRHEKDKRLIRSTTTTQQAFILLHELGHITEADDRHLRSISEGISQFDFSGDAEAVADRWALDRVGNGGASLSDRGLEGMTESILVLFAMMEVLRRHELLELDEGPWHDRFFQLMKQWAATSGMAFDLPSFRSFISQVEVFLLSEN